MTHTHYKKDSCDEALELLERSEREYRSHPIWQQLGYPPEKVFQAMEKLKQTGKLPPNFKQMVEKQKRIVKTRSNEKFIRPQSFAEGLRV